MIYGLAGFCPHRFRSHHFPSVRLPLARDVRVLILSHGAGADVESVEQATAEGE